MTVSPSEGTQFITFDSSTKYVSWYTTLDSYARDYTITILGTVNAQTTHTGTTSFLLSVIATCSYSSESEITITPSSVTNQKYTIGNQSGTYTIELFTQNSTICTQQDIIYAMTIVPAVIGSSIQFITLDSSTLTASWYSTSSSDIGVFTINIEGTIKAKTTFSAVVSFTLTVQPQSCYQSIEIISITPSQTKDQTYTIGDNFSLFEFQQFQQNSSICTQADIVYNLQVTPVTLGQSTLFIALETTNLTAMWFSISNSDAGVFQVKLTANIENLLNNYSSQTYFMLTVDASCQMSTEQLTISGGSLTSPQYYAIASQFASQLIDTFNTSSSSGVCTSANIIYSMSVSPTESSMFITFYSSNMTVVWFSSNFNDKGTYTITIIGKITNSFEIPIQTGSTSFILDVTATCLQSTEIIKLTPSQSTNQIYTVGNGTGFYVLSSFSQNSSVCTILDIKYSMSVQPQKQGQSTSFISFDPATITFYWSSQTNADVGTFIITLSGQIQADSTFSEQLQFNLIVFAEACSKSIENINIAIQQQLSNKNYTICDTAGSQQITSFSLNSNICTQDDIVYSMTVYPDTQIISFNSQSNPMTVGWYSTSNADANRYSITITGTINAKSIFQAQTQFVLTITSLQCAQYKGIITINQPSILPQAQNYTVNTTQGSQQINLFSQNSIYCTQQDIIYSMNVSSSKAGQNTSFITFNAFTQIVSWQTSDSSLAGTYSICITGSINTYSNKVTFILTVIYIPINIPPILQALGSNTVKTYQVNQLTSNILSLGPIYDSNIGDQVTSTMRGIPNALLFVFNNITGQLSFDLNKLQAAGGTNGITYIITIQLQDSNKISPGNTTYVLNFVVSPISNSSEILLSSITNNTKQNNTSQNLSIALTQTSNYSFNSSQQQKQYSPPYWKSMTIDNEGLIKIFFSEEFIIPAKFSSINENNLEVNFIQATSVDKKYLKFTWNVTQFTNNYFAIQLNFENPLYVSSQGISYQDSIQVNCLQNSFFKSKNSLLSINQESSLIQKISTQLQNNKGANVALAKLTNSLQSGGQTVIIGTAIANIMMSASLQQVWGMINSLQIIGQLPNFSVSMPANAQQFFAFITDISNLNIFPTSDIFKWIGLGFLVNQGQNNLVQPVYNSTNRTNTTQRSLQSSQQQNSSNQNLTTQSNQSIFVQLGPLFLVLLIGIILLILLIILHFLRKFKPVKKITQKVYLSIKRQIFWNATLTYIMESYLQLSNKSLQSINNGLNWSAWYFCFESLFTILTLTICFVSPIIMTVYFKINLRKFREKAFIQKFGSVINNLSWRASYSSNFFSIFCYRRLFEVILIQYLKKYCFAQVQLMTNCSILVVFLIGVSQPMREKLSRRLEFFNEATILCCIYHCYIFTPFYVQDQNSVYLMGYSMIFFPVFNIFINGCILVATTISTTIKRLKIIRQKYRKWNQTRLSKLKLKQQQNQEEQNKQIVKQNLFKKTIFKFKKENPHEIKIVSKTQQVELSTQKEQERQPQRQQFKLQIKQQFQQQILQEIKEESIESENDNELFYQRQKKQKSIFAKSESIRPKSNEFITQQEMDVNFQNQNVSIRVIQAKTKQKFLGHSLQAKNNLRQISLNLEDSDEDFGQDWINNMKKKQTHIESKTPTQFNHLQYRNLDAIDKLIEQHLNPLGLQQ